MSLFEVSDWNAPSQLASSSRPAKKRKRSAVVDEDAKIQSASVNFEKLMKKLGDGESKRETGKANRKERSKVQVKHSNAMNGISSGRESKDDGQARKAEKTVQKESQEPHEKMKKKRKEQQKKQKKVSETGDGPSPSKPAASQSNGLTPLQNSMKASLEGARFRHFNELLYKSSSEDARSLVKQDPSIIDDYHAGFRRQVQSWPTNPVNEYIAELSNARQPLLIADLGCGDATLAKALVPKGFTVLSFDLQSDKCWVIEADICSNIPLPGSEEEENEDGTVVDVVICALSLMSVNWVGCIREAWRILKMGGKLKVAEVTSRFEDLEAFIGLISSVGFALRSKDDKNTHFIKFDFTKVSRPNRKPDWKALIEQGKVLKPCEYKRR